MDSEHVKLLIQHKQQEIEDLRRVLARLQLAEENSQVKQEHTTPARSRYIPRSSTEAETVHSGKEYKAGAIVYYCKETRGKRRHFNNKGTIVKRDKRFLHIKTSGGDIIRRTPKYTRDEATIEA